MATLPRHTCARMIDNVLPSWLVFFLTHLFFILTRDVQMFPSGREALTHRLPIFFFLVNQSVLLSAPINLINRMLRTTGDFAQYVWQPSVHMEAMRGSVSFVFCSLHCRSLSSLTVIPLDRTKTASSEIRILLITTLLLAHRTIAQAVSPFYLVRFELVSMLW